MAVAAELQRELFSADFSSQSAEYVGPVKRYIKSMAERTGIIRGYRKLRSLFSDEPVEEPVYENHPVVLGKYFRPLARKIKEHFGKEHDFAPYFEKLRVRVQELPTYARRVWEIGRNYVKEHIIPVAKVHGAYVPETDELLVDPTVLPEINDEKTTFMRNWLRRYGIANDAESVIGHELIHYAQKVSGAIRNYTRKAGEYARAYIEGAATDKTEEIFGRRQRTYPAELSAYRKIKDRFGKEKAFLGDVPEHALKAA